VRPLFATPHLTGVVKGVELARIVRVNDENPVLGGLMSIRARILVHQTIFELGVEPKIFRSVAKLGREWKKSPISR
jgi:hypothetical protein